MMGLPVSALAGWQTFTPLPSAFLPLLFAVVAGLAEALQVVAIPEQVRIAPMRALMVSHQL
ncbi:hypothetical protein [Sulfitobacter faviae]|uniref:hypothetical protein n=1 Tax=Sulfitobacter faviae TaxID=1775881 RepID=UPI002456F86B|nr:hypothetical protein [Sulfitobacter faviae]